MNFAVLFCLGAAIASFVAPVTTTTTTTTTTTSTTTTTTTTTLPSSAYVPPPPLAQLTTTTTTTPTTTTTAPGQIVPGVISTNWSGYVLMSPAGYSGVTGSFVVPVEAPVACDQWDAIWAGVDGWTDATVLQAGVRLGPVCPGSGLTVDAWWESYPSQANIIGYDNAGAPFVVSAGDTISIGLSRTAPGTWSITVTDTTTEQVFSTSVPYSGAGSSVEWVTEAPAEAPCAADPGGTCALGPYGTLSWSGLGYDGPTPSLGDQVSMLQGTGWADGGSSVPSGPLTYAALIAQGFTTTYGG